MAKIERHKDKTGSEHIINIDTGEITSPGIDAWPVSVKQNFVKCCSLVEQIEAQKLNIVDETNITTIAYSLVEFGQKGKNLFNQTCLFQNHYDTAALETIWLEAVRRSKKKSSAFIKLCREKGLEVSTDEELWTYQLREPGKPGRNVTDELTESDIEMIKDYGHLEYGNCYYFTRYERDETGSPKHCHLERKSNFILQILYHITRGKINKRVVVLKNNRGKEVTLDIETNQITSFQKFKEVTEGSGNFLFEGSQLDLNKIKNKLFEIEKPCFQIETLGWSKKGFFTFCNGIWTTEFIPVDQYGIVNHEAKNKDGELIKQNFYIPYHPNTEESMSLNEKRFAFKDSSITWAQWAPLYFKTFGRAAMVCQVFTVATLFSDVIFGYKNNFPMLFLYGEGGSGKSTVVNFLQYLFGLPQPALKLSERANTDKAKIRKLAQFSNAVACLEEYINDVDPSIKKTLTGLYDRLGYERGTLESKFGTETVPIQSTVIITGNEYPDDDPLLQRLIILDYNQNERSNEVIENFDKLVQINRQGITTVTGQLLKHRQSIIDNFDAVYRDQFTELKKLYRGPAVPDRMIENPALLLAVYRIIQLDGREWPFDFTHLIDYLLFTIAAQADKRDTGAVLQRFWDIVLLLLSKKLIKNGRELKVSGNEISIRIKEIHLLYLEEHNKVYRMKGLASNTLLQKLKDSPAYLVSKPSERFGETITSSLVFNYDKIGVDLLTVIDYQSKEESRWGSKSTEENSDSFLKPTASPKIDFSSNENNGVDDLPF